MPLVKCGHCDSEHELGTKYCPKTGKPLSPPKSNATMFMFRAPGSPLPGSPASAGGATGENKAEGVTATGAGGRSAPTPPIGSSTAASAADTIISPPPRTTTGTHKAVGSTGTHRAVGSTTGTHKAVSATAPTGNSDTLAARPTAGAGTDSAIPVPVRTTGSRPTVGSGPIARRTLTPSAGLKEVPRPPVSADLVPPPPVDPALEGIVKNKVTGEHSRTTGGSGAQGSGSGPNRSRSVPSWVAAPEAAGVGSLTTAMFPAVDAPAKSPLVLVREALDLYKQHALVLILAAATVYVPGSILTFALQSQLTASMFMGGLFFLVSALVAGLTVGVIHPFTTAVLTVAASDRLLGGNASLGSYWSWIVPRLKPLLITLWMAAALQMLGMMLMFLPGLIITVLLIFAPMVVLIERQSGVPALKRSLQLVASDWRRLVLLFVGFFVAMIAISWPLMLIPWMLLKTLFTIALSLAVMPIISLTLLLLYLDNRRAKEGFDKEALRTQLDDLRNDSASNDAA